MDTMWVEGFRAGFVEGFKESAERIAELERKVQELENFRDGAVDSLVTFGMLQYDYEELCRKYCPEKRGCFFTDEAWEKLQKPSAESVYLDKFFANLLGEKYSNGSRS